MHAHQGNMCNKGPLLVLPAGGKLQRTHLMQHQPAICSVQPPKLASLLPEKEMELLLMCCLLRLVPLSLMALLLLKMKRHLLAL
jgi:hypothetical protein